MLTTTAPYSFYPDVDGQPLESGFVYFGTVNQNPETSPIAVYWDAALTQPAAQPLRTSGGLIVRNGTPAVVYTAADYSTTVKDKSGQLVIYAASSATFNVSSQIVQLRSDLTTGFGADISATGFAAGVPIATARFYAGEAINAHAHYAFLDNSTINYAGGAPIYGHASFNDNVTFAGNVASDHHHSFQSDPHYGTAAILGEMSGHWTQFDITAGTVSEASGVKVNNPLGAGAITNLYGVLINGLTRGTNNWAVYTGGTTSSFFGGQVWLGNGAGPQALIEYNSNNGHVQVQPRAGFCFKVGGAAGDRKLRLGDPAVDTFDATIENAADGRLTLVPRSGFGIFLNGTVEIAGALVMSFPVVMAGYTVATLPSAATYVRGRAYVSDANAAAFNGVVVGGGANKVPVFSDGINWRIG